MCIVRKLWKSTVGAFIYHSPPYFLRQSFCEAGDHQFGEDGWPASPRAIHLQLLNTEITAHFALPAFSMGIGDWNLVPHACMASSVATWL